MFLVNRLFGLQGPTPAPELMTIDNGRLYLVRSDSMKGSRECIFIDASISIRRTTHPHTYQLVVTRTFQDGEEQLLEEDAENSDERAFLLDGDLFLSLGPTLDPTADAARQAPLAFTWSDPDGEEDEFEFTLSYSDSASDLPAEFETLAWRCMWERRTGEAWPADPAEAKVAEATLEDAFKVIREPAPAPAAPKAKVPLFRAEVPDSDDDEVPPPTRSAPSAPSPEPNSDDSDDDDGEALAAQLVGQLSLADKKGKGKEISAAAAAVELPIAPPMVKPPTSVAPESVATSAPIVTGRGSLYMYDMVTGLFMPQEADVEVGLHRTQDGFWLVVVGQHCVWVSQGLELDLPINCALKDLSIVFNFRPDVPEGDAAPEDQFQQVFTWLVRFPDEDAFNAMQRGVAEAQYELKWGRGSWKKLKEDERDYQKDAYIEDAEMYNIPEEGADEAGDEVYEQDEEEEEDSDEETDPEDERKFAPKAYKAKNTQLAVGYKDGMSYVVQGDMIGVFRQQNESGKKLNFVTSIVGVAGPDGKTNFTPKQVMLHNQDTEMILQNDAGSLYRMDLEVGKVVEEYKVSPDLIVNNFIPDSKFAQMTQQQTFIGTSHNGIFRIDPRLAGSKLVESEFKQYATKNEFSVAATTESGRLAVASNKGDIRLFDKIGKNAKTVLPALGDAIIGLDVSADGRWVLATCKSYLLLVDTLIPEGAGRYGGSSGFDRSFPAAQKPAAKMLKLKAEHVALMDKESKSGVAFGRAKFNTAPGSLERTIVVSTGPFIVAWNFRQVKAGKTDQYVLRRFSDTVVADNFQFGGDRKIVTTPGNVFVEDKKKLKAPSRDSIAHIVNEWA